MMSFESNKYINFEKDFMPRFANLFYMSENYNGLAFLNQRIDKIKIENIDCNCNIIDSCICKDDTFRNSRKQCKMFII